MRRRSITRVRNIAYLQNQQQPAQYPPPPPGGGWGIPAPGGPFYPPKNEYPTGYTGGVATPQEPPKTYNPNQPAVSIVHHSSLHSCVLTCTPSIPRLVARTRQDITRPHQGRHPW